MNALLPRTIDNDYRGHKAALWLFGALMFMRLGMSLGIMFNGAETAIRADGIPLDTYPHAASQTILALFALIGSVHFMTAVAGVLALVRYRNALPLMFLMLAVGHVLRYVIVQFIPIVRVGHPPAFAINLGILIVMLVGLSLSLWRQEANS